MRHGDVSMPEGAPPLPDKVKKLAMNVKRPNLGGYVFMATDVYEAMGAPLNAGNSFSIVLHPDSRKICTRSFRMAPRSEPALTMRSGELPWRPA